MNKWLVVFFSCAFLNSYSQTTEEVIEKYITAMGGLDAFNKVNTAKMTGTLTTSGLTMLMTTQIVQGKAMRTDVNASGKNIINVYNNGKGWKVNPLAGIPAPTEVTGTELEGLKAQTSLVNHLMDYKNRGHKVELLGQEDVEGVQTFKIKLTNKDDNKATFYFINATNYLLFKSISKKETQGQEYDVETFYTDMKDINGLQFCMSLLQKIRGQIYMSIKWNKIELDVPVDEKIFEKTPAP
jgi:hypothetical protein